MNRNDLDGLLALKLVAEKRNFTAAARALDISPPAISKTIRQLEERLGVRLLSRTTRSTRLTEAGERFLREAEPALDQLLAAIQNISAYSQKPSGVLKLNVLKLAYQSCIKPLIQGFSQKHPDVTVELYFQDQPSDIIEGGFDAGIRLSDILAKDMVAIKLFGPVRFVVAGSPKYLAKKGAPKHPKELLAHECLRFRFDGGGLYDHWEFEHNGREMQVHVKGPLICNEPLILVDAAVAGLGLIYASEDSIRDQIESGKLVTILKQYASSSSGYFLYFPRRSQLQPKLRAFIDHVKEVSGRTRS